MSSVTRMCLRLACIAIGVVGLASCKVGPNYHQPAAPTTKSYTALPLPKKTVSMAGAGMAGRSQYFNYGAKIPGEWWKLFHSSQLNSLIRRGIHHSPNIDAAKAALGEAQQNLRAQIGTSYFPAISLQFPAQREQVSGLQFGSSEGGGVFGVYTPTLQASYTLDVFGGQRRLVETFQAQVDYARYELLAAYLSLTSNIASTYVNIASLQSQIKTTRQIIKDQKNILQLVQKQYRVGGASKQDVIAQETTLAQTIATLPPLQKSLAQSRHALAVLVGRLPSQLKPTTYHLSQLTLPKHLPVSLPGKLVVQRPDIQASSALLHAASAQIGVATANMLPQVTLSASYGWVGQTLKNLFQSTNEIWSYAAQLAQQVFQGGALIAQRRAAIAAYQESFAEYRQTVLTAFKQVSDALRNIEADAKAFKANYIAEATAKRTLSITRQRFKVGGENYLAVLNAQQQYLQNRLARIKAQALRYTDTVVLFQALGGGWWNRNLADVDLAQAMTPVKKPRLHSRRTHRRHKHTHKRTRKHARKVAA